MRLAFLMNLELFKRPFFLLFSFSFLFLTNCVFQSGYNSFHILPSVGEDSSPPDSNYFYMDIDETKYNSENVEVPLYEISTTEEYGDSEVRDSVSNCEIEYDPDDEDDPTTSSSETKICILDIMEHDLVLNNIPIIYNIPERMCKYVKVTPPWHYNYETGRGPDAIVECTPKDPPADPAESKEEEGDTYYCAASLTNEFTNAKGATIDPAKYDCGEVTVGDKQVVKINKKDYTVSKDDCAKEKEDVCKFNYTSRDETISCCYGNYRSSDGSEEEWSGSDGLKECLGGPGRTSWEDFDDRGFPASKRINVYEDGFKGYDFEVKSLLNVSDNISKSTAIANYLKELDKDPSKLRRVNRKDDLPNFMHNLGGAAPSPFFEVECLDSSGEVLHKLQMMIREWNTHEEFIDFYNSAGADDGDPNVGEIKDDRGEEGDDCDYEERGTLEGEDNKCNDSLDFKDIQDLKGKNKETFKKLGLDIDSYDDGFPFPRAKYNVGGE